MRSTVKACSLLVALAATMHAQAERGTIRGTVHDDGGHALSGVQLVVKNTDIRATSDTAGHFTLGGVWPGETEVEARRIVFQLTKTKVVVKRGDTTLTDITMMLNSAADQDAVAIAGIETNAPSSSRMRFDQQRARGGGGSYVTRADIERRHPSVMSDMLRALSGVSIGSSTFPGTNSRVQMERSAQGIGSGACEVQLYVDGHPYPRGNVDDFPPETVEGLEIYRGGAQIPSEFRAQNSACGLIAIWTRDPAAIKRQPENGR